MTVVGVDHQVPAELAERPRAVAGQLQGGHQQVTGAGQVVELRSVAWIDAVMAWCVRKMATMAVNWSAAG